MSILIKKNLLVKFFLVNYSLLQIYYLRIGGVTYDELGYRYGSKIIIRTFQAILKFDFSLAKSYYSDLEYYGQLVLTPSYFFSHFISSYIFKSLEYPGFIFYSYDDKFYFFSHLFLIVYSSLMLYLIFTLIKSHKNSKFASVFTIFLILTPSFSGHSLFNLKDIPFALHFFVVLLLIDKHFYEFKKSKHVSKKQVLFHGLMFGALLNIRINSFPLVGLFLLLYLKQVLETKRIKEYIFYNFKITLIATSLLIFLTPSMWIEPIAWWKLAIENQFLLKWPGSTLVNGDFIVATDMSFSYLSNFFLYKLPLNFILLFSIYMIFSIYNRPSNFGQKCLFFLISINLLFIYFKPTAYDGLRQYLFLLLPIIYISTDTIFFIKNNKIIFNFLFILNIVYLVFTQISLGPFKYVYFNELVDESSISISCENYDGCGNWSTDYWGYSGKKMSNFINTNITSGFLLVCRPDVSIKSYLNQETTNYVYNSEIDSVSFNKLNFTTTDTTIIKDLDIQNFYIVTFHRPRLNENSCLLEPNIYCEDIYIEKVSLRGTELNLSYLKKCNL